MNRLKHHYWLLSLLLFLNLQAKGTSIYSPFKEQCSSTDSLPKGGISLRSACNSRPAGLTCATAPLLCQNEFPYCSTLPLSNPLTQSFGCGSIENYHFLQFEAASTEIVFRVTTSNCTFGPLGNGSGVQVRVYEINNCQTYKLKYCRASSPIAQSASDTVLINELTLGNRYYLMLDGQSNDVCDYTISIESGQLGGKPTVPSNSISGLKAVCKNATGLTYSIPNQSEAIDYTWKVGGGATILTGQSTPSVSVNWGTVTDSICVKILGNCGEGNWACQKVEVMDVTPSATKSGDLSCDILSVKLTGSAVAFPSNATVTYEWINASNAVISTSSEVNVSQIGTYTLRAKVSLNGNTCEKTTTITVSKTGNLPNRPELQGDVIACDNKALNYNIVNAQSGISKYNWTITNGTLNSGATTPSVSLTWGAFATGKICVNAENSCGMSDTTCLNVVINKKPNTVTIAGNQTVCPSSIGTYTTSLNENGTTYQWTVPSGATIKNGQGKSSIDIDWGNSTGGQVCVTPSNSCGAATQTCINVTVKNAAPTSIPIAGSTTVCPNETATFSVTPDASITDYLWIMPANATILSGQGTPSVSVKIGTGTDAAIVLQIKNSCNLTTNMNKLVTIKAELPDDLPILGNFTVCSNDTSSFGVSGNAKITSYIWSVPTGATIISGQGTMTIRVAWGTATSGTIGLELKNACDLKRNIVSESIKIKDGTLTKPVIEGSTTNCPNSKAVYSVTAQAQYTKYTWSVPSNASILTNNNNKIEVLWNSNGVGDICLEVENDCKIKSSSCLKVEVREGIDSLTISGPQEVCPGSTVTYTCQKDPDAISYVWSVPTGSIILSGRGTNSIVVRFGTNSGFIVVQPIGGCASDKSSYKVNIKSAPDKSTSITGKTSVCVGDIEKYKAAIVLGVTRYNWILPAGATFVGADSTLEITVRWASGTGGTIGVKSQNECIESAATNLTVIANAFPTPNAGRDEVICGRQYTLKGVASVSTPNWTVLDKPVNSTITITDIKNPKSSVTVSQAGKYTLVFNEKSGNCSSADTVILSFNDAPQLTLINDNCSADGTEFTVKANINSFNAPFSLNGNSTGTINGNTYTSAALADGSSYSIVIRDASGCVSDTLKGKKTCPCSTQAAQLKDNAYVVCFGLKSTIPFVKNAVLDANDAAEFVLHNGTLNKIGTVLQRNTTGEFTFDATTMQYGTTYFVHHISGNVVNGVISSADRCYAISNGVSILFKNKITIGLAGDTTICSSTNANLIIKTTDLGTFKVTYSNQNQLTTVSSLRNGSTIRVSPSINTTFIITQATDAEGCLAEIKESVNISIRPKPTGTAGADKSVCEFNTRLEGAVPPQYKVTWKSLSGAKIADVTNLTTDVTGLKNGQNIFTITIKDSICTSSQIVDSVNIFVPVIPKAVSLALEMAAGDTIKAKVVEEAPPGTYSATRLDNPAQGRFDLFNNGQFTYISNPNFTGVVRFRFMICSETCTGLCDTGEVRILIKPKAVIVKEIEIDVPNAITPNDDGKNDVLTIDNIEKFPNNELTIFNRWGDILYRAKPYANDWNGSNQKGDPLPEGTYYYVLRLNINDGKILRGDLTVLR